MDQNTTFLRGLCPPPFYAESRFPDESNAVENRMCSQISDSLPGVLCCLPCPATDWLYPDSFKTMDQTAGYINVVALCLCIFLLLTFITLPVEITKRHYLNSCLLIGNIFISLGFVVPLAAKPQQCLDLITPHDMFSSLTCAWSGSFLLTGGLIADIWIFMRALSMHLQIVWDVRPEKKFFISSQVLGWGAVAVIFAVAMAVTGVSYRFGSSCHLNNEHSLATFWGFMIMFAGVASILQFWSFGYCIYVYLRNLQSEQDGGSNSTGLPSYVARSRKETTRAVYRRVSQVFRLQWRSNLVIVIILVDVIFFATVFLYLEEHYAEAVKNPDVLKSWLTCLVLSGGDAKQCFSEANAITLPMSVISGLLITFSMAGIQLFIILVRWDMFKGWWNLGERMLVRRREFVSLDAKHSNSKLPNFEMLKVSSANTATSITKPSPTMSVPASPLYVVSPSPLPESPLTKSSFTNNLAPKQRPCSGTPLNFSVPRRLSSFKPTEPSITTLGDARSGGDPSNNTRTEAQRLEL